MRMLSRRGAVGRFSEYSTKVNLESAGLNDSVAHLGTGWDRPLGLPPHQTESSYLWIAESVQRAVAHLFRATAAGYGNPFAMNSSESFVQAALHLSVREGTGLCDE